MTAMTVRDKMWASALAGVLATVGVFSATAPMRAAAETTPTTCCCTTADPSASASPTTDPSSTPSPVDTTTPPVVDPTTASPSPSDSPTVAPTTASPSPSTSPTPVTYPVELGWSAPGGTAASIQDLTTRYGSPKVVRLYTGPNTALKSWTGTVMQAIPRDAVIIYSFKDWPVDVNAWMNARPADWHTTVYLTLDHEPEQGTSAGDPTPAAYRQEWAEFTAQVASNPRRGEYKLTPIFTEYYAKRNAGTFWTDFGQVAALKGVDAIGFDIYDNDGSPTYRDEVERNAVPLSYARRVEVQKPLILGEWGIPRKVGTDPTGSLAAQAMRENMAYLRAQPDVPYVAWWYEDRYNLHLSVTDGGMTFVRDNERNAFKADLALN